MEELHSKLIEALRNASEGERFKQARGKIQRRVNTEEARLEKALRSAARELGLDLVRSEDEVQITALEEGAEPAGEEALGVIARAVEEFEATLAKVQDEADVELRALMKQFLLDGVKGCFSPVRGRFDGRTDITAFLADVETVVSREVLLLVEEQAKKARRCLAASSSRRSSPSTSRAPARPSSRSRTRRSPRSSVAPTRRPTPASRPSLASRSRARSIKRTAASSSSRRAPSSSTRPSTIS